MSSTSSVLVQHWVLRDAQGVECGVYISFHLDESHFFMFLRDHREVGQRKVTWIPDGNLEEVEATPEILRWVTEENALTEHGHVKYDLARAA